MDIHMTPDRNRCMTINTDPGCYRASDPDMALGAAQEQITPWPWEVNSPPTSAYSSQPLTHLFL